MSIKKNKSVYRQSYEKASKDELMQRLDKQNELTFVIEPTNKAIPTRKKKDLPDKLDKKAKPNISIKSNISAKSRLSSRSKQEPKS